MIANLPFHETVILNGCGGAILPTWDIWYCKDTFLYVKMRLVVLLESSE